MKSKHKPSLITLWVAAVILIILAGCSKGEDSEIVKDIDGNVYTAITIGTQIWMGENLKTTRYNDKTEIPNVVSNVLWQELTSGAYSWYDHDESTYKKAYGGLYNWYAANSGKLCPVGWRLPTPEDWTTLSDFLGGDEIAGGKLKETGTTHWSSPNTGATNETGFTGLPTGLRESDGTFDGIGFTTSWWSTEANLWQGRCWKVYYKNSRLDGGPDLGKIMGNPVRCIKE